MSSVNDNSFLENDEKSPNLGDDDSNHFEEKKAWQMQSQKNVLVKNTMEEMGWYWEHSRNDPESEKKSTKVGVITGLDEWQVSLMNEAFEDPMSLEPDQVILPDRSKLGIKLHTSKFFNPLKPNFTWNPTFKNRLYAEFAFSTLL